MRVNFHVDEDLSAIHQEFASVEELAEYARPFVDKRYFNGGMRENLSNSEFYGKYCPTPGTAFTMAREGWDTYLQETIDIARDAVETVEGDTTVDAFNPVWDVSGSLVDVGAFVSGDPECMIEIPPAKTTRFGRVVTLCASVSYSCSINEATLIARGKVITALALELSRLGIGLELYADFSATGYSEGKTMHSRVLVKGPNDVLDPAKVLFAYAHPGMLRVLALTAMHGLPEKFQEALGVGMFYGMPTAPLEDLPAGTIYLPELLSNSDRPDAAKELLRYMTELGLVSA